MKSHTMKYDTVYEWSELNVKTVLGRDRIGKGETEESAWFKLLAEHGHGGVKSRGDEDSCLERW